MQWWTPEWARGRTTLPLKRGEVLALNAMLDEWSKIERDDHAIESLPTHAPGDVEAVLLKVGALMRSVPPAEH